MCCNLQLQVCVMGNKIVKCGTAGTDMCKTRILNLPAWKLVGK